MFERLQEFFRVSPQAMATSKQMRAIFRAVAAAPPNERAGILTKASKLAVPLATNDEMTRLLAELRTLATPVVDNVHLQDLAEMAKEADRKAVETAAQARRAFAVRLKDLKGEANLTWDTIAKESGISRRRLYEISAGARPGAQTVKILQDYFSRNLKRNVQL